MSPSDKARELFVLGWIAVCIWGLFYTAHLAGPDPLVRAKLSAPTIHRVKTTTYRCLTPAETSFEIRHSGRAPYQPTGCWQEPK